ncbi:MAG: homogentisate 1,2-dioxygenase [Deltaproteobacteria bacterium]|nr:homogentisate 1,2-dioxygenase [Deltaproteobacteria bacterium]
MPFYVRQGELPRVKHTAFRKADGSLYREEMVSTRGFSGAYTTRYRLNVPSGAVRQRELAVPRPEPWPEAPVLWSHFKTFELAQEGDFVGARAVFLSNESCSIATARVTRNSETLFRNACASELVFVHRGQGVMESEFGALPFDVGDQLVIPRATTYRLHFDSLADVRLLILESRSPFELPAHYRNQAGQLDEGAPFCERDLRHPVLQPPRDERGEFPVLVKHGDRLFEHVLPSHPFDVAGWDGYLFPWTLDIKAFHPKVGRIHLPPPVHAVLRTEALVVCDFVPRPYDFHPDAVPAPYYHSNVDSDEVLYYAGGEFMSRKGVVEGSMTLHPAGMPHGPQPGRVEASIGAAGTQEYAVMIDTFAPLRPTLNVKRTLDAAYAQSWLG